MRVGLTGHYLNYQPSLNKKEADVLRNNTQIFYSKDTANALQATHAPFFSSRITKIPTKLERFEGCLLGGAIGDALGNPIEFEDIYVIKRIYGNKGMQNLLVNQKNYAEFTDDTQMTMFTADGIIKAIRKTFDKTKLPDLKTIFESYKLWLNTQVRNQKLQRGKGWIAELEELYEPRDPGITCLAAMRNNVPGTIQNPINSSSGCGGVMRMAPVGLMYHENPETAFKIGADCAALTHGNPRAYLAAGFLSALIAHIINNNNINESIDATLQILKKYEGHEPVAKLIIRANELAKSPIEPLIAIEELGDGWDGDEALAISTYCALKEPNNFKNAVRLAVNHSGDSDSTGAILGNILGAYLGIKEIPIEWTKKVELSNELEILANDLFVNPKEIKNADTRYPI